MHKKFLLLILLAGSFYEFTAQSINRKALVLRHTIVNKKFDSLSSLSVRMAYRMLLQPTVDLRVQRWRQFIADARGTDVALVDDSLVKSLQGMLGLIWRRVKWSNSRKCLYWQLVVGGIPTSARHNTGASCYCTAVGHDCPDRTHHFWQCPAAAAVAAEI